MMISALFNILCVGTFATFGLTCTLIHKLCDKKYKRRYPAIEYVPCPYKKKNLSQESVAICKKTTILKNSNQRTIMAGKERSSNYESDEENFSEECSTCSKCQEQNITICGTNSCRPNRLNVRFIPCPNACRGLCKVEQSISTPSEKSYSYNNEGSNQAISFCTSQSESVCSINLENDATRETSKSSLNRSTSKCDTSTSSLINLIGPTSSRSDQQKSDCSTDITICQTDVKSDASEDISTFLEVCKLNAFPCCGCHTLNSVSSQRKSFRTSQNANCSKDCLKQCCQTCNCVQNIEKFQSSTRMRDSLNDNKIKSASWTNQSDSEISYQASSKLNIKCSKECEKECCPVCICTQTNRFETSETSSQTYNAKSCSKECQKDCCSQCNCTQTIISTNETSSQTSNKIKNQLCSNECQTDCCTECKCSQTVSRSNSRNNTRCNQECKKNCCLDCNCAETSQFGNKTALHSRNSQKTIFSTSQIKCSQDCQTDCCTECKCSQTTAPNFHETSSQTKYGLKSLCNKECQKDCCTVCKCAQTDPIDIRTRKKSLTDSNFETSDSRNRRKSTICSRECLKDCCIECKCATNIKNRKKSIICNKECQMDCCTDCKCSQTDPVNIRTKCTKDCRKDCCTYCKCSQTSPDLQSRRKITLCSEICQTDCCKECKCAQTLNPSTWETSSQTENGTKACNKKCQKDCCIDCRCAQTEASNSWNSKYAQHINQQEFDKRKSQTLSSNTNKFTSCINGCLKDCCTECKCAQITNQQEFDSRKSRTPSSNIIKPTSCRTGCVKNCCTECKCVQTTNLSEFDPRQPRSLSSNIIKSTSCRTGCLKDCCTDCKCGDSNKNVLESQLDVLSNFPENKNVLESQLDVLSNFPKNKNVLESQLDVLSNFPKNKNVLESQIDVLSNFNENKNVLESQLDVLSNFPESDYPKSEFSVNTAKSSRTMMLKRKSIKRNCCSPLCLINNDEVLIQGDIQLKEMSNGPLKYVFETEESDHTVRVHELSLNVKNRGSQDNENFSVEEILDNYLLKLKVHS